MKDSLFIGLTLHSELRSPHGQSFKMVNLLKSLFPRLITAVTIQLHFNP